MDAYRCDGCKDYKDGDPPIVVYLHGPIEYGSRSEYHLHSWECLKKFASEMP